VPWNDFVELCSDYRDVKLNEENDLAIYGYPIEIGGGIKNWKAELGVDGIMKTTYQYGFRHPNRLVKIMEKREVLLHKLSSSVGQSGASIILHEKNREVTIIGVHKGHIKTKVNDEDDHLSSVNCGRLLSSSLIKILKKEA
jgi:hypothetical protein